MNVTKLALAIPAAVVSLSLALTGCTHASEESAFAVSYTHLTLPTILRV